MSLAASDCSDKALGMSAYVRSLGESRRKKSKLIMAPDKMIGRYNKIRHFALVGNPLIIAHEWHGRAITNHRE